MLLWSMVFFLGAVRRLPIPPLLPGWRGGAARMAASRPRPPDGSLEQLTVKQLKERCSQHGLPVSGVKAALIKRLRASGGAPGEKVAAAAGSGGGGGGSRGGGSRGGGSRGGGSRGGGGDLPGRTLMVVESPAKIATLSKFVGPEYELLACSGHVRALPSKPGSVAPDRGFEMVFEQAPSKGRVVQALVQAARRSSAVVLATDPDREGEAIAWHVAQLLAEKGALSAGQPVRRISFGEITKSAVLDAIGAPREIDMPLVRAQQARQAVDYLVGFNLSPILWRKLPGCRSAGRVQSVALRLLAEREEEVLRFAPSEYWRIALGFGPPGTPAGEGAAEGGLLEAEPTTLRGEPLGKLGER